MSRSWWLVLGVSGTGFAIQNGSYGVSQGLIQKAVEEGCSSLFEQYEDSIISKTRKIDFAIFN